MKERDKLGRFVKGYKVPKEWIDKNSESNKGKTAWNKGLTKETDERVKKISETKMGHKTSKEARKKMSESWDYDKHFTEKTRKKLSKSTKGKTYEERYGEEKAKEMRKNLSLSKKGKTYEEIYGSKEKAKLIKKKLSKASTGVKNGLKTRFKKGHVPWSKGKNIWKNKEHPRGTLGKKQSKEHIRKRVEKMSGKNNPNYGKDFSKEHRKNMSKARINIVSPKRDTKIEVKIQNFLTKLHLGYFTHKYISEIVNSYQCDIFIPIQRGIPIKTIIECDGCFYHACPICKLKKYPWTEKRRKLDKLRTQELIERGFRVIRLWEHKIKEISIKQFKERLTQ